MTAFPTKPRRSPTSWPSDAAVTPLLSARGRGKPCPGHLEPPERALWASITAAYALDDSAALDVLDTALQARGRMRRCREAIDRTGELITDRWGQSRANPLLIAERGARRWVLGADEYGTPSGGTRHGAIGRWQLLYVHLYGAAWEAYLDRFWAAHREALFAWHMQRGFRSAVEAPWPRA
jgi:hypothetical protein